jgi:hypothetical protein
MPKFVIDPIVIEPSEYLENCSPRDIDKIIEILRDDFEDELECHIHLSPDTFLEKCNSGELEITHNILHESYGIGNDDDARSEGQRIFNYHLACLKDAWYSVSREDADIIGILSKKYGAL